MKKNTILQFRYILVSLFTLAQIQTTFCQDSDTIISNSYLYPTDYVENSYDEANPNIEEYLERPIKSVFEEKFRDGNENNFKALRIFLKERQDLKKKLNFELNKFSRIETKLSSNDRRLKKLQTILKNDKSNKITVPKFLMSRYDEYYYDDDFLYGREKKYSREEIDDKIRELEDQKKYYTDLLKKKQNVITNIKNIEGDIYNCIKQIDSALSPEYKQQDFRTNISIYFTILIGLLLSIFFFIIYRRSDSNLSKDLLSGNGLQFVTLFVLIIAIILFGILSILQGSELAAILSGISGYILGKGISAENKTSIPIEKNVNFFDANKDLIENIHKCKEKTNVDTNSATTNITGTESNNTTTDTNAAKDINSENTIDHN